MVETAFRAKKLLINLAEAQQEMHEKINKEEIAKKIDEIKYLSTQKNVPRLSLRKEIVHLEKKLEAVFALEEKLSKTKDFENKKVSSLKRQITSLKKRLNATEDRELRDKVNRLYHVLTELLARSELKRDVELNEKLLAELEKVKLDGKHHHVVHKSTTHKESSHKKTSHKKSSHRTHSTHKKKSSSAVKTSKEQEEEIHRMELLLKKIKLIREEVEVKVQMHQADPKRLEQIEEQIEVLEKKMKEVSLRYPISLEEVYFEDVDNPQISEGGSSQVNIEVNYEHAPMVAPQFDPNKVDVKHTMIMHTPKIPNANMPSFSQDNLEQKVNNLNYAVLEESNIDREVISELPLPPPPRIKKRH